MATLFIIFVATLLIVLMAGIVVYLPKNYRIPLLAGLAIWIAYSGTLGYTGVMANTTLAPPGMFYMLVPIIMLVAFMARSRMGETIALSFPLWVLAGMESFRVVIEIFLHQLWLDGQIPKMMTFHGANFDILMGLSAPLVAWGIASGRLSGRVVLAWNFIGLAMLANIIIRAILTTPALHLLASEVPNHAIGMFPYTFIPGLMVPLALSLHVLAIRAVREKNSQPDFC